MLWEREPQASVSTAFSSSLRLSRRTCFLFFVENIVSKKRKTTCKTFPERLKSSISSLVRTWKICHSSPRCSFVKILRVGCIFQLNTRFCKIKDVLSHVYTSPVKFWQEQKTFRARGNHGTGLKKVKKSRSQT